jgi:two-component system response regulator FixJ
VIRFLEEHRPLEQVAQGWPAYIVDDDEAARTALARLLSACGGSSVHEFASGDEFLNTCHDLAPGCLFLDLTLPRYDGLEVLREMHRCNVDLVAIMITGLADVKAAVASMKAGAVDIIEKPCEPTALLSALQVAADRLDQITASSRHRAAAKALTDRLSPRELDVLQGLAGGDMNKVVAHKLGISPRTVEIHRANLMSKLGVRTFPEVLRIALTAGIVDDSSG